ncbi:MAG: hypothetical protein Q9166_006595 [cf. Caloplaca sp. 2 TL-2023]
MDYQAPGGRGCYNSLTKPAIAQSAAPQPATTAAKKVTSAANVAHLKRRNHVIAAVKLDTSLVTAPILLEVPLPEVWDTLAVAEEEDRSATNAVKSATSLATALMVVLEATAGVHIVEVATEVDTAVDMELVAHSKLATPVADTDTCLGTAPKDRNATTVEKLAI